MMKKLIAVLTMLAVCVSSSAYAAVGDVAGKVVYTDISAYINHYPIPAYAVNTLGALIVKEADTCFLFLLARAITNFIPFEG